MLEPQMLLTVNYSYRNETHSIQLGSEPSGTSSRQPAAITVDLRQQHVELLKRNSDASSDELDGPPDDLAYHIRKLWIVFVNWRLDWGEPNWEAEFSIQLHVAQQEGRICDFIVGTKHIVQEGRDLLDDLKFIGEVSCNNTPDEIRDLFIQRYDMAVAIALQVKFFKVKLHEIEHLQNLTL